MGGGTNTDPSNTNLGVYYKFNEGITGVTAADSIVLDFSGRVTNGAWTGYTAGARNTGSAMVSSSAALAEFRDPIVYSFHPDVVSLKTRLGASGSIRDMNNNASLYNSFPSWMIEEDNESGNGLKDLTQIIASYFDTVHLQIKSLAELKNVSYVSGSDKPNVLANRLLEDSGLLSPELFLDADVLEKLADRSEKRQYEESLNDIKNVIYKNIYNNLIHIYKTKGTIRSFRNMIRCFGIDDEIVKLNMYGDNIEFEFRDNTTLKSARKKFIDFNRDDRFSATIFQLTSSTNPFAKGYLTGSSELTGG